MIVNLGKRIKIDQMPYIFERDADTPGRVTVSLSQREGFEVIDLPGNKADAELFIAAYRRCVDVDIEYRETMVE